MHFPQSLIAQAEARLIANTDNQYLVPTSGNPLRGLIQDHVVSAVWLTNKDTFFSREEYYQLIYGALRTEDNYSGEGMIKTLPPTIWKPKPMWTGKQVVRLDSFPSFALLRSKLLMSSSSSSSSLALARRSRLSSRTSLPPTPPVSTSLARPKLPVHLGESIRSKRWFSSSMVNS